MEVIQAELRAIRERLEELTKYQKEMNGRVWEHQRWIDKRENEIDAADDRFRMLEQKVDEHQSYMDQRAPAFGEFQTMKRDFIGVQKWIEGHQAERRGLWDTVKEIALLTGLGVSVATLLKVFKVLP